MDHILIIGYGNPMRGDDGIGWRAAENLQTHYAANRRVQVLKCHQLTPELASDVAAASHVVFIDAALAGPTGAICKHCVDTSTQQPSFTHSLDPASLLNASCELFGKLPAATLVTVTGESFMTGEKLSPAVEHALPLVVKQTERIVDEQLAKFDLASTAHLAAAGT